MLPVDAFSPDYATARSRFRAAIAERGWTHEAHAVPAAGFADGDLTIDVARIGEPDAERLLVLSSGLHGGEGFFGSAAQLAWVDSLPRNWEPPAGCAVLLLHAINPFGFAALRRFNEGNVDLNRNFLAAEDFSRVREKTTQEYGLIDRYLNPPQPPGRRNWFPLLFAWAVARFGLSFLTRVIPSGQYAFPKGLFFGGEQLARSTAVIMSEMPRWVGAARFVVHLDFHTGLGRFGEFGLLASEPKGSKRLELARELFGRDLVKIDQEVEGGYHNFGDMGEWLSRHFAEKTYLYLCAEFGTYGTTRVMGALRRENQAYHWSSPDAPFYLLIKSEAVEVFAPTSPAWRWAVVHKSINLIRSALNNCAEQGTTRR